MSPSEMNMCNSVIQAFANIYMFNKRMHVIYSFTLIFSVLLGTHQSINHHNSIVWKVTSMIAFNAVQRSIYPNRTVTNGLSCYIASYSCIARLIGY